MPEISRFYGIKIYMFYNEHNPPHIHVQYHEYTAKVEINSGSVTGKFPGKELKLIQEWIRNNKKELIENWKLSENRISLKSIKPLD